VKPLTGTCGFRIVSHAAKSSTSSPFNKNIAHAPSFEEEYFLPDFDSLQSNLKTSEPPGPTHSNDIPEDVSSTTIGLGLDTSSPNLDIIDPWLTDLDFQLFSSHKDAEAKRDFDPERASLSRNPASLVEVIPSSIGIPPFVREPPLISTSPNSSISLSLKIHGTIHCDWPSCPRTLPTKSAYK